MTLADQVSGGDGLVVAGRLHVRVNHSVAGDALGIVGGAVTDADDEELGEGALELNELANGPEHIDVMYILSLFWGARGPVTITRS